MGVCTALMLPARAIAVTRQLRFHVPRRRRRHSLGRWAAGADFI
jgi:hypothetical protein